MVPFIVIQSPSLIITSPTDSCLSFTEIFISLQPTIQHLPQPLATNAACEVIPPLAVNIASAACIPWTSSGEVSSLTRMTCSPLFFHSSASSAVNTTLPLAPPGPAGSPFVNLVALSSLVLSKAG